MTDGCCVLMDGLIFYFKQKTAYERCISDWSSDLCSSDLKLDLLLADSNFPVLEFGICQAVAIRKLGFEAGIQVMRGIAQRILHRRSEERRVGKECVSSCRSRWLPSLHTKHTNDTINKDQYLHHIYTTLS